MHTPASDDDEYSDFEQAPVKSAVKKSVAKRADTSQSSVDVYSDTNDMLDVTADVGHCYRVCIACSHAQGSPKLRLSTSALQYVPGVTPPQPTPVKKYAHLNQHIVQH